MAVVYHPDGRIDNVQPAKGGKWSLAELQKIVGGSIQLVPDMPHRMLVNENGLLEQLPFNSSATLVVRDWMTARLKKNKHLTVRYWPQIVGTAIVLEKGERM